MVFQQSCNGRHIYILENPLFDQENPYDVICLSTHSKCQRSQTGTLSYLTLSVIGLEFFSSLEFGFPGAHHFQSTVELVLQLLNGYEDLSCDGCCKTFSAVNWRWRAPGKLNSNGEKNSNPIPETVTCV